jgi:hypothetical protein
MLTSSPAPWLMLVFALVGAGPDADAQPATPEARAVAYLAREVPRWSRANHCFSCHNNGDAARALYQAARAGIPVPAGAMADTTTWLSRPASWDHNGGDGPFSDKRLARIVFTATLATAVRTQAIRDRGVLLRAAERLALDQAGDGSWPLEGGDSLGSPAAYSRPLATYLARESLAATDPVRFRAAVARADTWLSTREIVTITDAAVGLLAAAGMDAPAAAARRRAALELLRRAQAGDGGWGPDRASPPEPFDTAMALLGLARCGPTDEVDRMIARGRKHLIAQQQRDGGWIETTRPPGGESYAQRISTTGWATLALLATRDRSSPPAGRGHSGSISSSGFLIPVPAARGARRGSSGFRCGELSHTPPAVRSSSRTIFSIPECIPA